MEQNASSETDGRKYCTRFKEWMVTQCAVCESCDENEKEEGENNAT